MSRGLGISELSLLLVELLLTLFAGGCRQEMDKQPKYLPLERSAFFTDHRSARPLIADTVARGHLQAGNPLYTGLRHPLEGDPSAVAGKPTAATSGGSEPATTFKTVNPDDMSLYVDEIPVQVTQELLLRGQERYTIFCAVCHDARGTGHGIVVQRGFSPPPSYHIERLRAAPLGYLFEVISRGYGSMPDYADQIPPRDRWAIAAYVRTLQWSQYERLDSLPPAEQDMVRAKLTGNTTPSIAP
jgi:mono/diheme cytochrome c family protein